MCLPGWQIHQSFLFSLSWIRSVKSTPPHRCSRVSHSWAKLPSVYVTPLAPEQELIHKILPVVELQDCRHWSPSF